MTAVHTYRVLHRRKRFTGTIFTVVSEELAMPDGGTAWRDYVRHPGAVVIVALDDDGSIVLVRQYRHAVRQALWEAPAGLLDIDGEAPLKAARRELAEETDLSARRWHLLAEILPSPGMSDELVHVYLARDLAPVSPRRRHRREHEESEIIVRRVDLDEAVGMVFRSEITNAGTVVGVLATARARDEAWTPLRPPP